MDGVFEPVRKGSDLNNKYHGNKRELDWWTVEKPVDWNPLEGGKQVTLDHDYRRPGTGKKPLPGNPSWKDKPGSKGLRRTMEYIPDRDYSKPEPMPFRPGEKGEPELFAVAAEKKKPGEEDQAAPEQPATPAKPEEGDGEKKKPAPRTTLLRGAEAYHEFEAERKAEKEAKAEPKDADSRPDVYRGKVQEAPGPHVYRGEVTGRPEKEKPRSPDLYGDKPDWWQLAQASRASGHKGNGNLVFADDPNKSGPKKRGEYAGHRISNDKVTMKNDQRNNPSPDQRVQKDVADLVNRMLDKKTGVKGLESININSTTGGNHSPNSRHYKGGAIDINRVNGKPVSELSKEEVRAVTNWLLENGYSGSEIFGPRDNWKNGNSVKPVPGHHDHIHYGGDVGPTRYWPYKRN